MTHGLNRTFDDDVVFVRAPETTSSSTVVTGSIRQLVRMSLSKRVPEVAGVEMPANVLWIIAVIVAVIGVIVLISGSILWGIILLVLAALIGPGGYSIFNRRP